MHALLRALVIVLILIPFGTHAQLPGGGSQINVLIAPEYPRPFDSVTARLESSYYNLAGATVEFFVNGEKIDTQDGKQAQFSVGAAGTRTGLVVKVTVEGETHTSELFIYPAEVSLIQEPQSSTFPLYKGGSLLAPEGLVRLVAVPNLRRIGGELIPANELIYEWRIGNKILNDFSGIGRSVLSANAPTRYRNADVVVTVRDQLHAVAAQARLPITPVEPFVLVYRTDPLMGLMTHRVIGENYTLASTEETFSAVPYYFNNPPTISWSIGGNNTTGENVTVRREGNAEGRSTVSLTAIDQSSLQSAGRTFTILFERLSSTLFNL